MKSTTTTRKTKGKKRSSHLRYYLYTYLLFHRSISLSLRKSAVPSRNKLPSYNQKNITSSPLFCYISSTRCATNKPPPSSSKARKKLISKEEYVRTRMK
jgi:hypothetical protein